MKKIVYNDIVDFDKIIKEYEHIRVKTKNRNKICKFECFKGSNLLNILNILKSNKYKHGKYNIFIIKEPKYRIIMSEKLNDKIVNHLVSNYVLIPLIEPLLINSNVATRKNKGTSYGLYLTKKYINKIKLNNEEIYVLKIDIKKYFFNIDHTILLNKLRKLIKDENLYKLVINIIKSSNEKYFNEEIVKEKNRVIKKIKNKEEQKQIKELPIYQDNKGLPIGNLSSQILAIYYLNEVDHYIKENLKLKYYIRYMDDFIIFHDDKKYLEECLRKIKEKLQEEKLEVNKKTNIYNLNKGVGFLGYRFKLKNKKLIIRINNQTKRRIKRKIKNLKIYNQEKLVRVKASYKGYLSYSNCNILKILK